MSSPLDDTNNDNDNNNNNNDRRLVFFIGPSKSASSSIEAFFATYASNDKPHQKVLPTFENWTYPLFQSRAQRGRGGSNGLAELRFKNNSVALEQVRQHIVRELQNNSTGSVGESNSTRKILRKIQNPYNNTNLFLASEYLVSFDTNHMLEYIINFTRPMMMKTTTTRTIGGGGAGGENHHRHSNNHYPPTEIIVNYRTPRIAQWISIWKQSTVIGRGKSEGGFSFTKWLCHDGNHMLWNKLAKHAHPLGLVEKLFQMYDDGTNRDKTSSPYFDFPSSILIHLIDMGGVARDGNDVAHVIACEVLRVPCVVDPNYSSSNQTSTSPIWVQGLERKVMTTNQRKIRQPNITKEQLDAFEEVFRQRDCSYQSTLLKQQRAGKLIVLHQDTLWKDCPPPSHEEEEEEDHDYKMYHPYQELQNVTYMMEALRRIVNCGSSGGNGVGRTHFSSSSTESARWGTGSSSRRENGTVASSHQTITTALKLPSDNSLVPRLASESSSVGRTTIITSPIRLDYEYNMRDHAASTSNPHPYLNHLRWCTVLVLLAIAWRGRKRTGRRRRVRQEKR